MNKQLNNWFVITGGPSSGKTTLIELLGKRGHATIPEVARTVIDEGLAKGRLVEEIRKDEKQFQDEVLRRKIAIEAAHNRNALTFFDRGMHDTIAYLRLYGWELDQHVQQAVEQANYRQVFLLEPLPDFQRDYQYQQQ